MKSPLMYHGSSVVYFEWTEAKNGAESDKQGRVVFDKILRVYIQAPRMKNQIVAHEVERHFWTPEGEPPRKRVNDKIKARYREQLVAWEQRDAAALTELAGTPLRELHALDVAQIAELKATGIHTVEQLAGLADVHLFMGAAKWREMARAYLEQANQQAPLGRLAAENEDLRAQIKHLQGQVESLSADAERKRGPGRPRKEAGAEAA